MSLNLLHGVPERGGILYDVSEQQGDQWREAVEAGALRQPQDHPRALQLGKHHGVVVGASQTQAETQRGVEGVGVHGHADHADTGSDEDGGHVLGQALHHDARAGAAV